MGQLIEQWNLCEYDMVVDEVIVKCDRPCKGLYCLEHASKMAPIDELEREVSRIVKGRKK